MIIMRLSLSYVRLINRLIKYPLIGAFMYLCMQFYNYLAKISLFFRQISESSVFREKIILDPSSIVYPWGVTIGSHTIIGKKVIINPRTCIGSNVIIHDKCVIGDTGFQILQFKNKRLPIIHTGKVVIDDSVTIESGSCVDRSLFGKSTIIGAYSSIGSNVKVGHNIKIGVHCVIGDGVAIGGNSVIGDWVKIGDNTAISNRIMIASNSVIPPGTILTRDIQPGDHI